MLPISLARQAEPCWRSVSRWSLKSGREPYRQQGAQTSRRRLVVMAAESTSAGRSSGSLAFALFRPPPGSTRRGTGVAAPASKRTSPSRADPTFLSSGTRQPPLGRAAARLRTLRPRQADGGSCRPDDPRPPLGRRRRPTVPLSRLWKSRDDRPQRGHRARGRAQADRLSRLALLERRSHLLRDRTAQPLLRRSELGMELRHISSRRAPDRRALSGEPTRRANSGGRAGSVSRAAYPTPAGRDAARHVTAMRSRADMPPHRPSRSAPTRRNRRAFALRRRPPIIPGQRRDLRHELGERVT